MEIPISGFDTTRCNRIKPLKNWQFWNGTLERCGANRGASLENDKCKNAPWWNVVLIMVTQWKRTNVSLDITAMRLYHAGLLFFTKSVITSHPSIKFRWNWYRWEANSISYSLVGLEMKNSQYIKRYTCLELTKAIFLSKIQWVRIILIHLILGIYLRP